MNQETARQSCNSMEMNHDGVDTMFEQRMFSIMGMFR